VASIVSLVIPHQVVKVIVSYCAVDSIEKVAQLPFQSTIVQERPTWQPLVGKLAFQLKIHLFSAHTITV
jgi:hypothetical protein